MTDLLDTILWVVNFGLPLYLVARLGWRGLVFGTLAMWVLVYASGEIQRAIHPHPSRFGMGLWFAVGWLVTSGYCGIVYGLRQFILHASIRWGLLDAGKLKYRS